MNKRTLAIILALIAVILIGGWAIKKQVPPTALRDTSSLKEYSSDKYGLSFTYPSNYILSEKELGNTEREHDQIMLVEDTEENRRVLNGEEPGREGPIAITLDIYQNPENISAENWIKGTNDSNFKLSPDGKIEDSAAGGLPSLKYYWDGLYRGETNIVGRSGKIFAWSVTYLETTDKIRTDFESILNSVNWK